jgi:hypothetical protein
VEKAVKGKQVPSKEDLQVVLPPKKLMQGQRVINKARVMTGQGRSINNMMNPAARMSPYRNAQ